MLYWIPNKKKASFEIEASFALLVVKKSRINVNIIKIYYSKKKLCPIYSAKVANFIKSYNNSIPSNDPMNKNLTIILHNNFEVSPFIYIYIYTRQFRAKVTEFYRVQKQNRSSTHFILVIAPPIYIYHFGYIFS